MSTIKSIPVFDHNLKPLQPTHPARARRLLREGRAVALSNNPFTIRLVQSDSPEAITQRSESIMGNEIPSETIKSSVDERDKSPKVSYAKSERGSVRESIHRRHEYLRDFSLHLKYPEGEPNPVYFIEAHYQVVQHVATAHVETYLGHYSARTSEFHVHNPSDQNSRAGAWQQEGERESWGVKYNTTVTETIPRHRMNADHSVGELIGHHIKTWNIVWSYMWDHSPSQVIEGVMRQDPRRWLETPHDDIGQLHTHTYEAPDKEVFVNADGVEIPLTPYDEIMESLSDHSITELMRPIE